MTITMESKLDPSINPTSSTLAAALEAHNSLQPSILHSSTPTAASLSQIPIIDLSNPSSSAIAHQIRYACTTTGFFYLSNHTIPSSVCDGILSQAARLFRELPQESKDKLHMKNSRYFRGYEPAHYSSTNGFEVVETKEAFNWGYEEGLDLEGGDGLYVELDGRRVEKGEGNIWPREEELPGFYEGIKEYYGMAIQLSRRLFRLFALSLSLPENYFDPLMTHPGAISRLIKYTPQPSSSSQVEDSSLLGLGAHTDYECFTLLLQDPVPGLEILLPNNEWISAPPIPGTIVVNVGDFLMRWTNGLYRSTVHRVVNRTEKTRYSVPLFFSVNYDAVVESLDVIGKGETETEEERRVRRERFPPITAGRYVLERLALTVK